MDMPWSAWQQDDYAIIGKGKRGRGEGNHIYSGTDLKEENVELTHRGLASRDLSLSLTHTLSISYAFARLKTCVNHMLLINQL